MSEELEIAFVDKLYPLESMPLDEVQREPAGCLFWTNSRGLERVFAYQGGDTFIGLDVSYDVNTKRSRLRFASAGYSEKIGLPGWGNEVAPIIKVGQLLDGIDVQTRNPELMVALMGQNVTFWDEYIDWCQQGLVKKVFQDTESYQEKLMLATDEREMFTVALQGLKQGTLEYKDQTIWLN